MNNRFAMASVAAMALAACAAEDDATETPTTEETTPMPEPAPADAPDPATPQGFVTTAASSDMYEIEAGRLAQEMGSSQAVKDFGAMMVKDHTTSSDKLRSAVASGGAGLATPPAMLPKHQQQLDALRSAGADFDRVYTEQQVAAHREALALLQGEAATGTVASLKAFASTVMPVVQGHLDHVRGLAGDAGGGE
ncbi:MAG TPA: DUF4142 domain-containing protein [Croceibacterium sp.]